MELYYKRLHSTFPRAAWRMRRSSGCDGCHLPPCATKRLPASTTVPCVAGFSLISSASAKFWRKKVLISNLPWSSNLSISNKSRSIPQGARLRSSTIASAIRTRLSVKQNRAWLSGSLIIAVNLEPAIRYKVSSGATINIRTEQDMARVPFRFNEPTSRPTVHLYVKR